MASGKIRLKNDTAPGTPASGYGVIYGKSSDKKLYWKDDAGTESELTAGAAGGETNTASNSGTDGVGVFDQKVGVDLEFRHVASTESEYLTVTLDATDDDIDLEVLGSPTIKAIALKESAGTINPGDVVYVSNWSAGNGVIQVELADADNASAMPAVGIAQDTITAAATGAIIVVGPVTANTTGESVGNPVYVDTTAGAWTTTRPTGTTAAIQRIGTVVQVGASGTIYIAGALRSNDVPNLEDGKFWLGNGSNVATAVSMSGDATMDNTGAVTIASGAVEGTEIASTGEVGGTKYLREDGDGTCSWQAVVASETNNLETTCTGILADEVPVGSGADTAAYTGTTGTGNVVRASSPTIVTPTIASFANAGHDHEDAAGGGTLASAATPSAIHDDTGGEINAITEKASPVGADVLIIEDSAASYAKKRVQITNLPAGSEINDLAADGINGIADDQLPVGTGAGTAAYQTLPNGAVSYDTTGGTFSQASASDLTDGVPNTRTITVAGDANEITVAEGAQDLSANRTFTVGIADAPTIPGDYMTVPTKADPDPTGADGRLFYNTTDNDLRFATDTTWRTVVSLDQTQTLSNKTLTTPTIGDFTNATHDHSNAAGGGTIDHTDLTTIGTNTHAQIDTHIAATTGHGATGAVMGTTNTQTVTNKDLTSETNKLRHSKSITLNDSSGLSAGTRIAMFMNERAITVLGVSFASLGGTSIVLSVEYNTSIASGTVVHTDTCATATPEWDVTPSGDATIPTDQIICLELGTVTGTVTQLQVTVYYDED